MGPHSSTPQSRTRTPLPKLQVFVVLLIQLAEPISATVIFPFINQFVNKTGITHGDETKTGYYAGVIESIFFFSESVTVLGWGMASDRFGRRPVLLLGPMGLAIATWMFGLSTKYWELILFRSLQGVFNGNLGVSKTVLAELSDATNMAIAFSFTSVMWQTGYTVGSSLGGILSDPADQWPKSVLGRSMILRDHPYLLPCIATGFLSLFFFCVAFVGLRETRFGSLGSGQPSCGPNPSKTGLSSSAKSNTRNCNMPSSWNYWPRAENTGATADRCHDSVAGRLQAGARKHSYGSVTRSSPWLVRSPSEDTLVNDNTPVSQSPPSIRSLLVPDVLYPLTSYCILAFLEVSMSVLLPLTFTTSIAKGGLGLSAMQMGTLFGAAGITGLAFSSLCVPFVIRRWGVWKMHFAGMCAPLVWFIAIICACAEARRVGHVDEIVWACVAVQHTAYLAIPLGFTTAQMFVINSAPSKDALGTTNGMVQSAKTFARTVAPICVTSLFSFSKEHDILDGYLVYVTCLGITLVGLKNAFELPKALQKLD